MRDTPLRSPPPAAGAALLARHATPTTAAAAVAPAALLLLVAVMVLLLLLRLLQWWQLLCSCRCCGHCFCSCHNGSTSPGRRRASRALSGPTSGLRQEHLAAAAGGQRVHVARRPVLQFVGEPADSADKVNQSYYRQIFSFTADDPAPAGPGGGPLLAPCLHGCSCMAMASLTCAGCVMTIAVLHTCVFTAMPSLRVLHVWWRVVGHCCTSQGGLGVHVGARCWCALQLRSLWWYPRDWTCMSPRRVFVACTACAA
jgi:hypothetical protein